MSLIVFLLVLLVGGFIIGGLARLAVPGPDPMPWYATVGLGIGGSLVAGLVTGLLVGKGPGFLFAFLGAVLLLTLYRRFVQRRSFTGRTLPPR